ncbi:phasin family protein [Bradyrhizobium neotropicale]|uniref:phasin family protein n=1 Tax=Bradyrhizobium neotropicale TaxID=1497615 RepID=UPI001AD7D9D8|nr:phasin family protein [Bradyrhizobium neotropicale]MBO4221673.1 phasin family protein [Bradyrhizobium neotropicale]
MLSADGNKPVGKSSQRKGKTGQQRKKVEPSKEARARQVPEPAPVAVQLEDAREQISEQVSEAEQISEEVQFNEPISAPVASIESASVEASAADTVPALPTVAAEPVAVSVATIADAYSDYTRKSLNQTLSFLEKLAAVRSLDKVFELQTEFAKQAFETFIAESQKISKLHGELARQRVLGFEGFVARITQTTLELRATRH